uniref:Uncharacterized protein n=1 Tax=Arundo donax TaxID=35708 RepID=A0A0A8ZEJ9_ARUDO
MVTLANLRRLYGDVVHRASLSRDLLVPLAGQLSGDPASLHRRCVLGQYLGFFRRPDDVRADLAPFGAIEAVAVCELLDNAVIVFREPASVAVALRRQEETPEGIYNAVPPLDFALPLRFIQPKRIEVAVYPPPVSTPEGTDATSGDEASTQGTAEPRTGATSTEATVVELVESRPVIVFLNSPDQGPMTPLRPPPGTTRFAPSLRSRFHGPTMGADGHLWMDGLIFTYYEKGMRFDRASIRVVQVAPPDYY